MQLIVLSHPCELNREKEAIEQLFSLGVDFFHIRKPGIEENEIEKYIQKIPEKYHRKLILHSHYNLAKKYNLKGIHITEKTKNSGIEKQFKDYHTSISIHCIDELNELTNQYNYAFISPVFDSISKQNYKSRISPEILKKQFQKNRIHTKVVALGGINPENIKKLNNTGIYGCAVLGFLWEQFSRNPDLKILKEKYIQLKNMVYG